MATTTNYGLGEHFAKIFFDEYGKEPNFWKPGELISSIDTATGISYFREPMKQIKFKVGDRVIGNARNTYSVTRKGWIGTITAMETDTEKIEVSGITCFGKTESYWVSSRYFDLYESEKDNWEELRKLFKH